MPLSNVCYSYSRFSSGPQAEGDSVRRQTALRDAYLKRHPELKLDATLTLTDAGVSGFKGRHRKDARNALARFTDLVDRGRVPKGATLLVESIDRLGREHPEEAVPFLLSLVSRGVRIVTLAPEYVFEQGMDVGRMLMLLLESFRGHGESARKADLSGAAWSQKKAAAREARRPIGRMCPAWLEVVGARPVPGSGRQDFANAKYVVKAEAAAAVRKVFELAAAGWSTPRITRHLNDTGVPAIGRKGVWVRSYVQRLLSDPAPVGTYQPRFGSRGKTTDGEPVEDFYPAVVSPAVFERARAGLVSRMKGGRPRKPARFAHPFQGLLVCALDKCGFYTVVQKKRRYVVSMRGYDDPRGGTHRRPFPLSVLCDALLSQMRELAAADLFSSPNAGELTAAEAKLAAVERRLRVAVERFEADPDSPTWAAQVTKCDVERRLLVKQMADLRAEAASPLPARWDEAVALMARDEPAKLRLALSGVVESVHLVIVKKGVSRLCAAQAFFAGGAVRSYLIGWKPGVNLPGRKRPEDWGVESFAAAGLSDRLDLRIPDHARRLETALAEVELADTKGDGK